MSDIFLKLAFFLYIASGVCFCLPLFFRSPVWEKVGRFLLMAGFTLHSSMVAIRWYEAGRPPFANMFEALVLFSWAAVLAYIVFDLLYQARFLAFPVNILAIALLSAALPADSAIKPLVPALQSRWMSVHVITYFIGYGALSVAFVLSAIYLVWAGRKNANGDVLKTLDGFTYRLIIFGFPFLTAGMITGSVWANSAWGTYWNWDPKETCSLITWLVYLVYLHARILRGWKGKPAAYLSLLGFLATLFTFVGVNFILPGLHSYS